MKIKTESIEPTVKPVTPVALNPEVNDVVISDFDTAALQPGHFVESMQLRLSLAARAHTDKSLPYVDVLFKNNENSELRSVGSIVIDDETSNAINGGYLLLLLPSFIPVEELKEAKVVLRMVVRIMLKMSISMRFGSRSIQEFFSRGSGRQRCGRRVQASLTSNHNHLGK